MAEEKSNQEKLEEVYPKVMKLKKELAELLRARPAETVEDYTFEDVRGNEVKLSSFFGPDKNDLILIHNMGMSCPFCTMWADGFVGLLKHLESRAAFVLTSPDAPDEQGAFARSRGWNFPTYSARNGSFIQDMGMTDGEGGYMPGFSIFHRDDDGEIQRVAWDFFGPGDNYCATWHFFDLLPGGTGDWEPKIRYEA